MIKKLTYQSLNQVTGGIFWEENGQVHLKYIEYVETLDKYRLKEKKFRSIKSFEKFVETHMILLDHETGLHVQSQFLNLSIKQKLDICNQEKIYVDHKYIRRALSC